MQADNVPVDKIEGGDDLFASLTLRAVAKATFKRKRLWQKSFLTLCEIRHRNQLPLPLFSKEGDRALF